MILEYVYKFKNFNFTYELPLLYQIHQDMLEYGNYEDFISYQTTDTLNDEVEIIEDTPKKDKKIEKLGAFNIKKFYDDYPETAQFILEIFKKQEELIKKVNGE